MANESLSEAKACELLEHLKISDKHLEKSCAGLLPILLCYFSSSLNLTFTILTQDVESFLWFAISMSLSVAGTTYFVYHIVQAGKIIAHVEAELLDR